MIKELKENKSILHNRHIKVTILTVLPLVIGCLGSAMGQWNVSEDAWFYPKLVCLVALSIIEIAALWKYTSWDKESQDNTASLQKAFNELEKEKLEIEKSNNAYIEVLSGLSGIFQPTARKLNTIAHQIEEEGKIDLSIWSFKNGCQNICDVALSTLKAIAEKDGGDGFTINYIQKEETSSNVILEMPAYSGREDIDPPIIRNSRKSINEIQKYYYARLFQENNTDIVVLENEEKITKKFYLSGDEVKYSQYIGIPVVCSGKKMIGLFQIVAYKGSMIAYNKSDLEEIAQKYFTPLAICAMFMNKVEKAMRAIPDKKVSVTV